MKKVFFYRKFVTNPEVIDCVRANRITTRTLKGPHVRVIPKTAREVLSLQMLEHRREKYAPARGNGVILTPEALERIS